MLTVSQINALRKEKSPSDKLLASLFYALSDPGRLKALKVLLRHDEDICVSEIAAILNVSTPAASRQLKILEQGGLIDRERMGQMVCYRINKTNPVIRILIKIIR